MNSAGNLSKMLLAASYAVLLPLFLLVIASSMGGANGSNESTPILSTATMAPDATSISQGSTNGAPTTTVVNPSNQSSVTANATIASTTASTTKVPSSASSAAVSSAVLLCAVLACV